MFWCKSHGICAQVPYGFSGRIHRMPTVNKMFLIMSQVWRLLSYVNISCFVPPLSSQSLHTIGRKFFRKFCRRGSFRNWKMYKRRNCVAMRKMYYLSSTFFHTLLCQILHEPCSRNLSTETLMPSRSKNVPDNGVVQKYRVPLANYVTCVWLAWRRIDAISALISGVLRDAAVPVPLKNGA